MRKKEWCACTNKMPRTEQWQVGGQPSLPHSTPTHLLNPPASSPKMVVETLPFILLLLIQKPLTSRKCSAVMWRQSARRFDALCLISPAHTQRTKMRSQKSEILSLFGKADITSRSVGCTLARMVWRYTSRHAFLTCTEALC